MNFIKTEKFYNISKNRCRHQTKPKNFALLYTFLYRCRHYYRQCLLPYIKNPTKNLGLPHCVVQVSQTTPCVVVWCGVVWCTTPVCTPGVPYIAIGAPCVVPVPRTTPGVVVWVWCGVVKVWFHYKNFVVPYIIQYRSSKGFESSNIKGNFR